MSRIRTIKPEFWTHEALSMLPEATHLLAAALLNYADDEGYFNANPALIRAACSPLREPSVSIQDSLTHLSIIGYLRVGAAPDGRRYGQVSHFDDHQRVNRPTPSKIKELAVSWEDSLSPHAQLTESSPLEGKGKEGKAARESAPAFDPASVPGLDPTAWSLWVEHRSAINKKIRPHSMRDAAEELAKLGTRQLAEVRRARAGGWQGIHPEKNQLPAQASFPKVYGESV